MKKHRAYWSLPGIVENLAQQMVSFAGKLPDLQGIDKKANTLIFSFIAEGKMPFDILRYRINNINKYALMAYRDIFYNQDKNELLKKDYKIMFIVYFWDMNTIVGDVEFIYSMNDPLFI